MIDRPPASGAVVHAYGTDAFNFANHFAKFLCDLVWQSKAGMAKRGYTPTVAKFCRDWSVEDTMNENFVESGTDFSARHRGQRPVSCVDRRIVAIRRFWRRRGSVCHHPRARARFHGDNVTMADVCLVHKVINVRNFDLALTAFPIVQRISDTALGMPAFERAMPSNQKDFE